ncbi:formate dehydrogenase [Rhodospirillaceae bacterium SYSU D60014]|uniref:formate dehydrogenase n=1 Tax=Virgifigura deserti TaxID=2268457 RepID=UPI0013C4049E
MVDRQTGRLNGGADGEARGIGRRALLAGIGAGGVTAAAMAAAGSAPMPTDDQPAPSKTEPVYRETPHIREFYSRSRF